MHFQKSSICSKCPQEIKNWAFPSVCGAVKYFHKQLDMWPAININKSRTYKQLKPSEWHLLTKSQPSQMTNLINVEITHMSPVFPVEEVCHEGLLVRLFSIAQVWTF